MSKFVLFLLGVVQVDGDFGQFGNNAVVFGVQLVQIGFDRKYLQMMSYFNFGQLFILLFDGCQIVPLPVHFRLQLLDLAQQNLDAFFILISFRWSFLINFILN